MICLAMWAFADVIDHDLDVDAWLLNAYVMVIETEVSWWQSRLC